MPLPPILKKWINAWLKDEGSENVKYDSDLDGKIDQLRTILRSDLEYPTEDVSFAYLQIIGKVDYVHDWGNGYTLATIDSFTDKAIFTAVNPETKAASTHLRHQDTDNTYFSEIRPDQSTADHNVSVGKNATKTVLASEGVDLQYFHFHRAQIAGSTISSYRDFNTGTQISATDTTFASGKFGAPLGWIGGNDFAFLSAAKLLAPTSELRPALSIIEAEITGTGTIDDPIRPDLVQLLDMHSKYGQIDKYAVTWGAFDHKEAHATMLIVVTGDNPYQSGAIEKQIEHAKSKNLKVLKPPRDYAEAIEQYLTLKRDFPEWLAGKENFAYQTLGHEDIEPLAVADFYHGELIEHKTHYDQLKRVSDWELERTLKMWEERLERATAVPTERKELHVKKLKEVLRGGW